MQPQTKTTRRESRRVVVFFQHQAKNSGLQIIVNSAALEFAQAKKYQG